MGTTSTEAKASSLIAAAWLKASRIAYCFESRASLIAECRRLRDAQARLMSAQALRSAKAAAFAERLLRALSASGEDTRAEFSAHGISPDEIDRFLASMRAEGGSRPKPTRPRNRPRGKAPESPRRARPPPTSSAGPRRRRESASTGSSKPGRSAKGTSSSSDTRPRKPSRRPRPAGRLPRSEDRRRPEALTAVGAGPLEKSGGPFRFRATRFRAHRGFLDDFRNGESSALFAAESVILKVPYGTHPCGDALCAGGGRCLHRAPATNRLPVSARLSVGLKRGAFVRASL